MNNTKRITTSEFRNRMGRYISAVLRGQTLVVTRRGKPLAKVSAAPPEAHPGETLMDVLKRLEAEGKIRLARRPLGKFRPLKSRGKSASRMLIEDRR